MDAFYFYKIAKEKKMKKIVVLTGAGISAESGIKTFRDADGLWEGHDIMKSLLQLVGKKIQNWF